MTPTPRPYPAYKPSGVPWLGDVPVHWDARRGGGLFHKMDRPVCDSDEVITCFRDGTVTLRKNRRTEGFTESLKEIGYQGVRKGDLVIHQMDAFAGAVGVSDSVGKVDTSLLSMSSNPARRSVLFCAYRPRNGTQSMDLGSCQGNT